MAKVVLVDNYNREYIADRLLSENLTDSVAKIKADMYNEARRGSDTYAVVKPDTYKLWCGIEEFV